MVDRRELARARFVAAPPSEQAWDELVSALEAPEEFADADFEAVHTRLASWPQEIRRVLPLRWIFQEPILVGRGGLRPRPWPRGVALATHLDLSAPRQPVLSSSRGDLLQLFQARELEGLRSIDLGYHSASPKQRAQIAARPTRHALRQLSMRGVDARGLTMLTGSCLAALEELDLRGGDLGPAEVALLLQTPSLARLTHLWLARNPITDAGLALFVESRCLTGDLERTGVTDAGLHHLADSRHLAGLEQLTLSDNRIGPSGVARLMASRGVSHLHALALHRCAVGPAGAQAIAEAPHLGPLRVLDLGHGKIGGPGLRALAGAWWVSGVEELDLSYCDLDDAALRPLSQLRSSSLRRLKLSSAQLSAHGLGHLLASPAGSRLEELHLYGCRALGPQGAAAIARAPTSKHLRVLNLQNCSLGAEGARALASSPYLRELRELWIWGGDLLREGDRQVFDGTAALRAGLPGVRILG